MHLDQTNQVFWMGNRQRSKQQRVDGTENELILTARSKAAVAVKHRGFRQQANTEAEAVDPAIDPFRLELRCPPYVQTLR